MFNPCIGIVSYLPNDVKLRDVRITRLHALLDRLAELMPTVPIIIIAQNWNDVDYSYGQATLHTYNPPFSILAARKTLRQYVLDRTSYNYLIMLDDDAELVGTPEDAAYYLSILATYPEGWFTPRDLKLAAFSRVILSQCEYVDVDVSDFSGFEDVAYIERVKNMFPQNFIFISEPFKLQDKSNSIDDIHSTWHQSNKLIIRHNMYKILRELGIWKHEIK